MARLRRGTNEEVRNRMNVQSDSQVYRGKKINMESERQQMVWAGYRLEANKVDEAMETRNSWDDE